MKLWTMTPQRRRWMHRAFFILLAVAFLGKSIAFQYDAGFNIGKLLSFDNRFMVMGIAGVLVLILSLAMPFPPKVRGWLLFGLQFGVAFLMMADLQYMRYHGRPLNLALIYNRDVRFLGEIRASILALYRLPHDLIYLIDLPLTLGYALVMSRRPIHFRRFVPRWRHVLAGVLTGMLLIAGSLTMPASASVDVYYKHKAGTSSIVPAHLADFGAFIREYAQPPVAPTAEEAAAISRWMTGADRNARGSSFGTMKGMNLMMLQIEALQEFVPGMVVEGREVTPNLNQLIKESTLFDNIYYEVGDGNTSDAEFMTQTGMYGLPNGAIANIRPEAQYPSMAKLFRKEGYSTLATHSFKPEYWSRDRMYVSEGFDKAYFESDYVMDEQAGWAGGALSDRSFLRQLFGKLPASGPFYAFAVTLSSHHPFEYFRNDSFPVGRLEGTFGGNYLKAMHFMDDALGVFMKEFKARGYDKNTVLVLYGDHFGIPRPERAMLAGITGDADTEQNWFERQKIPLVIHTPGQTQGQVVSRIGGQVDVLPTVTHLFGIQAENGVGRDMLAPGLKGYAVTRDGSVVTDAYILNEDTDHLIDRQTGNVTDNSAVRSQMESLRELQRVSDLTLTYIR